ncbi:GGDEF domain-containing protein [Motiliproteus sp. MSK22-1]|uniref:GGDEF domain-containing protein n=1 Tax=Motiliproteus sp. MSK22-1 TaxID=1897630 RepID=UPI000975A4EB|nr:GGDEF domain-containing protein [Motiliproteus sp. MSK22-1]OMH25863.1 hypothetical protein BGP75_25465 [Motiliproteus sp. MSK22-1]
MIATLLLLPSMHAFGDVLSGDLQHLSVEYLPVTLVVNTPVSMEISLQTDSSQPSGRSDNAVPMISPTKLDDSVTEADTRESVVTAAEKSGADTTGFDWGHIYVRIGIVIAAGLMFMSVLLSYFNRRLRREVEQRWRVEEKLQDSESRLSLALWGANLGCWDWDLDTGLVHIDAHGAEMLGGKAEALDVDINQEDKIAEIFLSLVEDMDSDEVKAERHIKVNSGSRWVLIRGRRLRHSSGRSRAFGTVMDVSTDHAYQEKLVKLSITDPLTGLLNRRYFFDRLNQSCSHCQRDNNLISIALLDIDNFKEVNDNYGHLAGDQTLAQFAQMLKEDCRPYDLVARFGGEEFIILFFGMGKHQANKVLERYQERLRTTQIVTDGNRLYCTFSCGIADSNEIAPGKLGSNEMVKLADERLYYAKGNGRNQIVLESVA